MNELSLFNKRCNGMIYLPTQMGYVYPAYGFCVCVAVEVEYASYRVYICTGMYIIIILAKKSWFKYLTNTYGKILSFILVFC
jgi:hypothetical protein